MDIHQIKCAQKHKMMNKASYIYNKYPGTRVGARARFKNFVFPLPYVIMNVIISYEFQQWYQSQVALST